ncbi:MAG: PRC-barrel domain-containing protein [Firmicutes bacterium]|nr:PRC-barrel domain-containing protein [Bacillota bacterium]
MISLEKLLALPVIDLLDGNHVGYVKNIVVEEGMLTKIVAFNEEENDLHVNAKDVFSFGTDAITLKTPDNIIETDVASNRILGSGVFTGKGIRLGTLQDIVFSTKTLKAKTITIDGEEFNFSKIASMKHNVIVLKGRLAPNAPRGSLRTATPTRDPKVSKTIPERLIINHQFLIGRKLRETIFLSTGEVLAEREEYVTKELIINSLNTGKLPFLIEKSY